MIEVPLDSETPVNGLSRFAAIRRQLNRPPPSDTCYEGTTNPPSGLHGPISMGTTVNRIYIPYGVSTDGVIQILDRSKVLNGCRSAAAAYPQRHLRTLNLYYRPATTGWSEFMILCETCSAFAGSIPFSAARISVRRSSVASFAFSASTSARWTL